MIRFSPFLVIVAFGLLVAGVVTSQLALVYIAIAVGVVSLLTLLLGMALNREELSGRPRDATGDLAHPDLASSAHETAVPVASGIGASGSPAGRPGYVDDYRNGGYGDHPGPGRGPERAYDSGFGPDAGDEPDPGDSGYRDELVYRENSGFGQPGRDRRERAGHQPPERPAARRDQPGYADTAGHTRDFYYTDSGDFVGSGFGGRDQPDDVAARGGQGAQAWQDDRRGGGQRERDGVRREYPGRQGPGDRGPGDRGPGDRGPGDRGRDVGGARPGAGVGGVPGRDPRARRDWPVDERAAEPRERERRPRPPWEEPQRPERPSQPAEPRGTQPAEPRGTQPAEPRGAQPADFWRRQQPERLGGQQGEPWRRDRPGPTERPEDWASRPAASAAESSRVREPAEAEKLGATDQEAPVSADRGPSDRTARAPAIVPEPPDEDTPAGPGDSARSGTPEPTKAEPAEPEQPGKPVREDTGAGAGGPAPSPAGRAAHPGGQAQSGDGSGGEPGRDGIAAGEPPATEMAGAAGVAGTGGGAGTDAGEEPPGPAGDDQPAGAAAASSAASDAATSSPADAEQKVAEAAAASGDANGDGPAGDEPSGESAGDGDHGSEAASTGDHLVTVVPGVPRFHRSECILIRFMGEDDLQRMPLEEAKEAGCTPCRACQPD